MSEPKAAGTPDGARLWAVRRALASDTECSLRLFLRGQWEPGRLLCKRSLVLEVSMTPAQIVANVLGLAFIGWVVWYFWLYQAKPVVAAEAGRAQEVRVRVRGGYDPDVIVVRAGRPVRLHFYRQEDTPCSEMVVFPSLAASARLAPFQDTVVEVTPPRPGEYDFQCQMGMLRGRLVAE